MSTRHYLLGQVGPYGVLVPADLVSGVWMTGEEPRVDWTAALAIDLRSLLGLMAGSPSAQVALQREGTFASVIVLDAISDLRTIADNAFKPLPRAFRYARDLFDGLSTTPGHHALRLRRDPSFFPLVATA